MASILDYLGSFAPTQNDMLRTIRPYINDPQSLANIQQLNQSPQVAQTAQQNAQDPMQALSQYIQPAESNKQNFGDSLMRVAAATNGANSLADYDLKNAKSQSLDPSFGAATSGLTGEDLLKSLPPQVAATIKGYSEGRIPFSSRLGATPQGQKILNLINQYDPQFDAASAPARAATYKDFTSGKSAQNITALNTALGHLDSLNTDFQQLDNGSLPWWNSVANKVAKNTGNTRIQTAASNIEADRDAVAGEMAKVFRSTGMSTSEIDGWKEQISSSKSPEQMQATVKKAVELLGSRLDALGQQYNQGMGTTKQGIELLSPHAQEAWKKVTGEELPRTGVTGNIAADNAVAEQKQSSPKRISFADYKAAK